jgi:hypothetical protein
MLSTDKKIERDAMEWFTAVTENGVFDEIMQSVVSDLVPYARAAAARANRRLVATQDNEMMLVRLGATLQRLATTFEDISLNPDMMAVAGTSAQDILHAITDIHDWLYLLDHREDAMPQAVVAPSAAAVMANGGVP